MRITAILKDLSKRKNKKGTSTLYETVYDQPNESGQRFDKYLKKLLSNASGSFVYKMLRKKNITLNDRKADGTEKLNAGDLVKLFLSDETFEKFSGKDETNSGYMKLKSIDSGRLQVVYEDDDVIIINKPSGMLSQKAVPRIFRQMNIFFLI